MLRGRHTYLQLFDTPIINTKKTERRGRSEVLHTRRNELLIHRYYYYLKLEGMQYAKTLATLEEELIIAQQTIINNVANNRELLKELNLLHPDRSYFRKKYPWLVW